MDLTIYTDDVPEAGETVSGYGFITNPGGKGSNQAAAAARLGARTEMIGAVGCDAFGNELKTALQKNGAGTGHITEVPGRSTGVAVIVVSEGDNRILLDAGANGTVTGEQMVSALRGAGPGDLLVCQLEIPHQAVLEALRYAKKIGMTTILNPAPAADLPDDFFRVSDWLVPNEHECFRMCGIEPADREAIIRAGESFLSRGTGHLLVTLGTRGAALYDRDGLQVFPSRPVQAVDSTAAGDSFIGAFAAALLSGRTVREAVFRGTRAGALTVTRKGAQQSLPDREELESFIREETHE